MYFLTLNKEAQAKLYEEIDRNTKAGIKDPSYSDLSKYPYVKQVRPEADTCWPVKVILPNGLIPPHKGAGLVVQPKAGLQATDFVLRVSRSPLV